MDLYRLRGDTDLRILDIPKVLETCICLVEWPDRLGAARPLQRLGESLCPGGMVSRNLNVLCPL